MRTIWKYAVKVGAGNTFNVPGGYEAEPLLFAYQELDGLFVWFLVDDAVQKRSVTVDVVGTGWPVVSPTFKHRHIGSFVNQEQFVWHAFLRVPL